MPESRLRRGAQAIPGAVPSVRAARRAAFARRLRRLHDVLAPTTFAHRYWVWSGLLLGWAREGRPLDHDLWDVDFAFLAEDLDHFLAAEPALAAGGFTPRARFCADDGTPWEYRLQRGPTQFEFWVMEPDPARVTMRYRSFVYAPTNDPLEMLVCELPYQAREQFPFLGRTWRKVADHEAELTAIYGDWRTPDPSWTFLDSADVVDRQPWSRGRDRWGTPR
jgi:hypothetical protein